MRPLKLTMSAFLSYGEKQDIDFTELGTNGLYLITGETGAGKTTIFDAIIFALYGEASGDLRDGNMFRSKYADLKTETYVELLFECNGKQYRVRRSPAYERAKKRGEGTTNSLAEAELEFFDGRPIVTKVELVTKEVEKIIGLSKTQFSQIAMIAQGQFRELLVAETKERREIFRHIFETGNYDKLQQKVSDECKELSDNIKIQRRSIEEETHRIMVDPEDKLHFPEKISDDEDFIDERIITPLSALFGKDNDKFIHLEQKLKELEKDKDNANARVTEANKRAEAIKDKAKKHKEYIETEQSLKKAEAALDDAKKAEPEIQNLVNQVAVAQSRLGDYDTFEEKKDKKSKLEREFNGKKDEQGTKITKRDGYVGQFDYGQKELESLSNVEKDLSDAKISLKDIENKAEKSRDVLDRYEELKEKKKKVKKAYSELQLLEEKERKATDRYRTARDSYYMAQAGLLAAELKEGEKCPVCGSIHHPEPAVLTDDAVTKEQLDEYENNEKEAREDTGKANSEFTTLSGETSNYEKETIEKAKELVDADDLQSAVQMLNQDLQDKIEKLGEKIRLLKSKSDRKTELTKDLPELQKQIENANGEITSLEKEIITINENINNLTESIEELESKLEFNSKQEALDHIDSLNHKREKLENRIKDAKENQEKYQRDLDTLHGEIIGLERQINSFEELDVTEQETILNGINEQIQTYTRQKDDCYSKLNNNKGILDRIKEKKTEITGLLKKYVWLKALDDTMAGKSIDKNGKLMLETYVQQAYFDRIVAKANTRFYNMSQGHYTMSRIMEPIGGRQQSGLDLEVIDHYNGTRRTVKSLSGGEQFEASLSLALGLSDMVQEMSAGVKLDCMFIDEGFGSLDDGTLHRALVSLKELSDGNRLVGIISHINELQKEIDKKIIVRKDARGFSKAEISVD